MLWILAFHIIFVVTWFSGVFYLPRLFVYHAMSDDKPSNERFKIMERKLYYGITLPSAILATGCGIWLFTYNADAYLHAGWMHVKLFLVALLWVYQFACVKYMNDFKHDKNRHGHVFYRWFNEVPTVILIGAILLVVIQP